MIRKHTGVVPFSNLVDTSEILRKSEAKGA